MNWFQKRPKGFGVGVEVALSHGNEPGVRVGFGQGPAVGVGAGVELVLALQRLRNPGSGLVL